MKNAARVRRIRWIKRSINVEFKYRTIHVATRSVLHAFAAYREVRRSQTGLYPSPLLPNVSHLSWTLDAKTLYIPHLVSDKLETLEFNLVLWNFPKNLIQETCGALGSLLQICKNLTKVDVDGKIWEEGYDELIEQILAMPIRRFRLEDEGEPVDPGLTQFRLLGSSPQLRDVEFYIPAVLHPSSDMPPWPVQSFLATSSASSRSMFRSLQVLCVKCNRMDVCGQLLDTVGSTSLQSLELLRASLNRVLYLQLHQFCKRISHFQTLQIIKIVSSQIIRHPIDVAIAEYPLEP